MWQTPVAMILIKTSPGPGDGIGTSSIVSGLPNWRTTAAFIISAMTRQTSKYMPLSTDVRAETLRTIKSTRKSQANTQMITSPSDH